MANSVRHTPPMAPWVGFFRTWLRGLVLASLGLGLGAQETLAPVPPGSQALKVYGRDQGLTSPVVWSLLEDRHGFLWAGTDDGLFRFDGRRFEVFGPLDGLPSSNVTHLHPDPQGLWIGTPMGLALRTTTGIQRIPEIPAIHIRGLGSDAQGRLWVGTQAGPYVQVASRTFRQLSWPGGLLTALRVGAEGTWATYSEGARSGLRKWDGTTWRSCTLSPAPTEALEALALTPGRIWVRSKARLWGGDAQGSALEGVGGIGRLVEEATLYGDPAGRLWVPHARGLTCLEGGVPTEWNVQNPQVPRVIHALLQDREGHLWLGGNRLYRTLARGAIQTYTTAHGLPSDAIWWITRDRHGNLVLGTGSGAVLASSKGFQTMEGTQGFQARTVVQGPDGAYYLAGHPAVLRWDPRTRTVQRLGPESGFTPQGRVWRMIVDPYGRLWLGTEFSGLFRGELRGGRWTFQRIPLPGEEPSSPADINDLRLDAHGRIWLATTRGLRVLEGNRWHRLDAQGGLLGDNLFHALPLQDGTVLLSYLFSTHVFTRVQIRDGKLEILGHQDDLALQGRIPYFVGQGPNDQLWVGTGQGFTLREAKGTVDHFGYNEGLVSEDSANGAFWKDPDGTVWMGTSGGLHRFDPRAYAGPPSPPEVRILHVQAGSRSFHETTPGGGSLGRSDNTLSFRLAAPSWSREGSVSLRCRLKGLEEDWHASPEGLERYPKLPRGHYTLEAQSRTGLGPWSPTTTWSFTILPAWWETPAFRTGVVLLLGGALTGLVYLRLQALRQRNLHLEAVVAERTQELRTAKDAAEKASAFKSIFVATTSHELRTPLNAILGFLRMMDRGRVQPREQRQYIRVMQGAADALLQLVNDLLDLHRIEAGALALESVAFSPRRLLAETLPLLSERAREKGLILEGEVAPELPERLVGDAHRLRQMLVNLLGNALKFTAQGRVTCRLTLTGFMEDKVRIRLEVEDTGEGVPAEVLPRLFLPFTQAESRAKHQGTGLGLSITRHLAELMDGGVGVETEQGQGSTFWAEVVLGLAQDDVKDDWVPEGSQPGVGAEGAPSGRILVADDNEANRVLVSAMLRQLGTDFRVVEDGEQAVEAFRADPYDLVILDGDMPRLNGLETMQALRAHPRGAEVPILLFTASGDAATLQEALGQGFDATLAKPIDPEVFQGIVRQHLAGPSMEAPPTLDRAWLDRLAGVLGGSEALAEYISAFLVDGEARLRNLQSALEAGDRPKLQHLAHDFKSNAGHLGLKDFSQACATLETRATVADLDELARQVQGLCQAFPYLAQALARFETTL